MANTKNVKKINEYKRILREILDTGGLKGAALRGSSTYIGDWVYVFARTEMDIEFRCEGQNLKMLNHQTRERREFDLADPSSIDALREVLKAERLRLVNG